MAHVKSPLLRSFKNTLGQYTQNDVLSLLEFVAFINSWKMCFSPQIFYSYNNHPNIFKGIKSFSYCWCVFCVCSFVSCMLFQMAICTFIYLRFLAEQTSLACMFCFPNRGLRGTCSITLKAKSPKHPTLKRSCIAWN